MSKITEVESLMDSYNTFSGCDMTIVLNIPLMVDGKKITKNYVVGEIQTLTYSTSMDRQPIRSISNVNAKDYVMGQRTIAGSMVFSVFDSHFADRIIKDLNELYNTGINILVDELPPFDINIIMANEYGNNSSLMLYGVRFVNEGQVMSINDIYMENTYQYVATGLRYADNTKNKNQLIKQHKIVSMKDAKFNMSPENNLMPSGEKLFDIPKNRTVLEDGKNMSYLGEARLNNYEDEKIKYSFVNLSIRKHGWINNKQEVSLTINPNRTSGEIIIKNMDNEEMRRFKYYGEAILYALKEGEYYARYTDDKSASNVEYIKISKRKTNDNNKNNSYPVENLEKNENKNSIKDKPIIDDIEDDNIKVTVDDVILKDKNQNIHYPDKHGYINNLKPETEYILVKDGINNNIKTNKDKYDIYEKLKESLENHFNGKELELANIIYELERKIYLENKDTTESIYNMYKEYVKNNNKTYAEITKEILFFSIILVQNKKVIINNNTYNMPTIDNYSTSRIKINNDAIKLVIQKLPDKNFPPMEIYKEHFINKNGKAFYEIKDEGNFLYKVYTIDKNGIRSPFIYLFSGMKNNDILHTETFNDITISEMLKQSRRVKQDYDKFYYPLVTEINESQLIISNLDVDNGKHYISYCDSKYLKNRNRIFKTPINNKSAIFKGYDLVLNDDSIYLTWIEDEKGNIISKALPFVKDQNKNNVLVERLKEDMYSLAVRTPEYKALTSLSKTIFTKVIEENPYFSKPIKENFIKSLIENESNSYNLKEDITLIDRMIFNNSTGYEKKDAKDILSFNNNKFYMPKGHYANIDVICKLTGTIKTVNIYNQIDLNRFKNKILIINIKGISDNIIVSPLTALVYNEVEVIW